MDYLTAEEGGVMRRFVKTALKETPAIDGPKYTRYMSQIPAGMVPILNRASTYHLLDDIVESGKSLIADCACNKAVPRRYKAKVYPQATQQAFKRNRARGPQTNGQDQYMGFQNQEALDDQAQAAQELTLHQEAHTSHHHPGIIKDVKV